MKKKLLVGIVYLFCVFPITAQTEIIPQVDAMITEYVEMNLFSGTVMIAEEGVPIYHKAFGYSDIENEIKNKLDTKFNFGSIGKMFTGVAILELAELGKLNLDDKIGMYIDFFPDAVSNKITIRQLLMHTAGLGDYLSNPKFRMNIDNFNSLDDLMNLIKDEPILFEPGTNSRYSNSGYATLGAVIESVTGKSFYTVVKELVLDPLGLTDTYYPNFDLVRNDVVKYMRDLNGNIVKTPFKDWPSPAGGEYSTSSDLMKFIQGVFYTNKVLTDESKAIFLNRFDPEPSIGFGEMMQNERFIPMWAGGAPGVNGMICQFFKRNITITALSNYSPPAAMDIVQQIRQIIETGSYSSPRLPLEEKLYKVFQDEGEDYIENNFSSLTDGYRVRGTKDNILNNLGYNLLGIGKNADAISVFKVNTKLFPEKPNTFDSLAEAYMLNGNKAKAIENYRKVLDLNPGNPNALKKLKELGADELE